MYSGSAWQGFARLTSYAALGTFSISLNVRDTSCRQVNRPCIHRRFLVTALGTGYQSRRQVRVVCCLGQQAAKGPECVKTPSRTLAMISEDCIAGIAY